MQRGSASTRVAAHFPGTWVRGQFHNVHGPNAIIEWDDQWMRFLAKRLETSTEGGAFAFTSKQMSINEKLMVRVTGVDRTFARSFTFGLTTCDPSALEDEAPRLPNDHRALLNRPEVWVFKEDVDKDCGVDDELVFVMREGGDVQFSRNNRGFRTILQVGDSQRFYAFFDVSGRVTKLTFVGTQLETPRPVAGLGRTQTQLTGQAPHVRGNVLSTRSSQPLSFHEVHGENVLLERNNKAASRVKGYCKGIVFSSRPVQVNEKIRLRIGKVFSGWSGLLRLGFTSHDPRTLAGSLPDTVSQFPSTVTGHWAGPIGASHAVEGTLVEYKVCSNGDVLFTIEGKNSALLLKGVNTRSVLWAMVDIYGATTAIQIVDGADVRANETRTAASSTQVTSNTKTEKPDPKPEKTEDHLCRLCFDKDIDCVLVDCGHLVTCYACGLKLFMGTPLCPVCRKPIKQLVKTFKT